MDTLPRLAQAARDLRAKVAASLPWGQRVARLLHQVRFATEPAEFGQAMYGLFLLYGVVDMPPAPFMPKNTREITRLKGYGREFGKRAFGTVFRYIKSDPRVRGNDTITRDDLIQDVLSRVFLKLYSDTTLESKLSGQSLSYAEHYTLSAVKTETIDTLRREKTRAHDSIDDVVEQPAAWDNLGDLIPEAEQKQIIDELEGSVSSNFAKDIGLYFKLILDGYSDVEITRGRMLPYLEDKEVTVDKADGRLNKYKQTIKTVLEDHFDL
jgi:hypothetical protein